MLTFFIGGIFSCLGYVGSSNYVIYWISALKFCGKIAYQIIYPYTVELYPTKYRVIGTSVAMAFGRVGGMVMPFIILN